ncbi:MAG: thioredoxin domain-containing protein [Polyangiales bacterium]
MRRLVLCLTLAFALLGCEGSTEADSGPNQGSGSEAKPAPKAPKAPIRNLPQVDTSALDEFSKGIWIDMVNELLSPCGEPVSVARCIADSRNCKKCVPAARYVARLVDDGYSRDEVRDIYRIRYGEDTKVTGITTGDSPLRGSPMAPVTLYEFSDFQCPHCKMAAPMLKKVVEESNGKVKLVFKQYPLPGHPKAREASKATIAAQKQGKFWEMHDLLFKNQDKLQTANFADYAKKIGLDVKRFEADMASKETEKKIDADIAEGHKAGVDSTPSVYVNDRRFVFPPDQLGPYVQEELDQ